MNSLYDPYMVSFALAIKKLPSDVLVRMSEEIDKLLQERYDEDRQLPPKGRDV